MRMSVKITIPGIIDSRELYEDIKDTGAHVTDMGACTLVQVTADIRSDVIERVIAACNKYHPDCHVACCMLKD